MWRLNRPHFWKRWVWCSGHASRLAVLVWGLSTYLEVDRSPQYFKFLFLLALIFPTLRPSSTKCHKSTAPCIYVAQAKPLWGAWRPHLMLGLITLCLDNNSFLPFYPLSLQSIGSRQILNNSTQPCNLLWACNSSELHFFLITGKIANWQTSGSGYTPSDLQGRVQGDAIAQEFSEINLWLEKFMFLMWWRSFNF